MRGGEATDENDIAICDKCRVPYHQDCHAPPLRPEDLGEEEDEWWCSRCELVYDRLSNAVLDAYGVEEERARTFRRVQSLLEDAYDSKAEGADHEESEDEDSDYVTEESEDEDEDSGFEDGSSEDEERGGGGSSDDGSRSVALSNDKVGQKLRAKRKEKAPRKVPNDRKQDKESYARARSSSTGSYHSSEDEDFDSDNSSYSSGDSFDSDFY